MAGRWSNDFETAKKHIIGDVSRLILVAEKLVKLGDRLNGERQGPLRELVGKLKEIQNLVGQSHMKVVFFGSTSNGKSTLINALLGGKVLPTGCGSVSSCFCSIQGKAGPKGSAKIGSRTYDNLEVRGPLIFTVYDCMIEANKILLELGDYTSNSVGSYTSSLL